MGRGSDLPHLALISAPPSSLSADVLIGQQKSLWAGAQAFGRHCFFTSHPWPGIATVRADCHVGEDQFTGPIFYVQRRVGRDYQRFVVSNSEPCVLDADEVLERVLAKDPTLRAEFEQDFKLKSDPRITSIGRFLRRSSLDELPQFLNVLRGEMSVVGPRPIVDRELVRYGAYMDEVASVRPGLTGLWQVSGRNNLSYSKRIKLDLAYARGRSLLLDLNIILRTFGVLLLPMDRGAY